MNITLPANLQESLRRVLNQHPSTGLRPAPPFLPLRPTIQATPTPTTATFYDPASPPLALYSISDPH